MAKSLFIMPQEIRIDGLEGRLGAFNYLEDKTTDKEVIHSLYCRIPERILPQPNICFLNGLNPALCTKATCESEFYVDCLKLFKDADIFVSWSNRPLKAFEAMRLRLCSKESIFDDNKVYLDICTLLHSIKAFSNPDLIVLGNLLKTAKFAGFNGKINRHDQKLKLDALDFLTKKAFELSKQLCSFMLRPIKVVKESINKAIFEKKALVTVDRKGKLNLIIPLKLEGCLVKALCLKNDEHLFITTLDLRDGLLIAPYQVLTPQRQKMLNINLVYRLETIYKALNDLSSFEDLSELSLEEEFLSKLNDYDKKLYNTISMRGFDVAPILQTSAFFKRWMLLCRGDNYRYSLIDTELSYYQKISSLQLESQVKSYISEVENLQSLIDENNEDDLNLACALAQYLNSF